MNFEEKDRVWHVEKQASSGSSQSKEGSHVGEGSACLIQATVESLPGGDSGRGLSRLWPFSGFSSFGFTVRAKLLDEPPGRRQPDTTAPLPADTEGCLVFLSVVLGSRSPT